MKVTSATDDVPLVIVDSVTELTEVQCNGVVIAGSHGGALSGLLAARAGARGVILNDAGVGKERAGIGSLEYLGSLGVPAAVVSHLSARIGDGRDVAKRGAISYVNRAAAALGCRPGQRAIDCARRLLSAPVPNRRPAGRGDGRFVIEVIDGLPEVHGLDSISLAAGSDVSRILVSGSHGGLVQSRREQPIAYLPLAAVFNDAGIGIDNAGIGRLGSLSRLGVVAATVGADTARIGEARSTWSSGVVSYVNEKAVAVGGRVGMTCIEFVHVVRCKV